ncbi:hypothetical protein Q1695_005804 [Nippostrongylus brasiliensis]|nr:hypothetical protein Q1695_005804 [Nippostrongylus brasiliensis]
MFSAVFGVLLLVSLLVPNVTPQNTPAENTLAQTTPAQNSSTQNLNVTTNDEDMPENDVCQDQIGARQYCKNFYEMRLCQARNPAVKRIALGKCRMTCGNC